MVLRKQLSVRRGQPRAGLATALASWRLRRLAVAPPALRLGPSCGGLRGPVASGCRAPVSARPAGSGRAALPGAEAGLCKPNIKAVEAFLRHLETI